MQRRVCILLVLAGALLPAFTADELPDEDLERQRRILGLLAGAGNSGGVLSGLLGNNGLLGSLLGGGGGGGGSSGGGYGGSTGMDSGVSGGGGGGLLGGLLGGGGGGGGGLLGGLLGGGGGGSSGSGSGGGLLGGLLGGGGQGGLLGSLLGGGGQGGLLGNLLGGGGQGGLLGTLLGGGGSGGLLGGLLGGNSSLLGSLLGGQGLLGGVLGDKGLLGGLLGSGQLGALLNTVFCLLEQLGLGLVLELLNGLGVNTLIGLNEIACQDGGQGILGFLIARNGVLPLGAVEEILCLVKTIGARTVLQLLQELGLEKVLSLNNITCPDGKPLIAEGTSASNLFKQLISILGLETVNSVGVEGILKLDTLLAQERIQNVTGFISQVSCLIKNLGLGALINTLEISKVNGVLRLNEAICRNQSSLADLQAAVRAGVNIPQVLAGLLRSFGLDAVLQVINTIGLGDFLQLGSFLVVNGTVQPNIVSAVFCISNSLGLKVVIRLLQTLGLAEVLPLYGIVCANGQPAALPQNANPAFLVVLLNACKVGSQITQCLQ